MTVIIYMHVIYVRMYVYILYTEGCVFEDNSQIELTAVQKLEKSVIVENDAGVEEKEFDKDIQSQDNTGEKLEEIKRENDTGAEEKASVKENHDDMKSITEDDGAAAVAVTEQEDVAATTEPISLPCTTK